MATAIKLDPSLLGITSTVEVVATPPKAPSKMSGWVQTLLIIAAIVGCFLWLGRDRNPSPTPPGPNQVSSVAEQSTRDYAASLASAMNALAKSVDSAEIANAEQLKNNARAYTQAAREKSFAPVDRIDTDSIPAGEWTPEQRTAVSAYLRSKATGHEKASR